MDNKLFLQELIKQGLLTDRAAEKLAAEVVLVKRNIDDLIYERRLIDEEKLLSVKSKILGVPYKK